jgi:intracellular multiplication protein IcmP
MAMSPSGGNNDGMDIVFIIFACAAIVLAVWFFWGGYIVKTMFFAWKAEIYLLSKFTDSFTLLDRWIDSRWNRTDDVSWAQFTYMANAMGQYSRWVTVAVLLPMAAYLFLRMPEERFKRQFDMNWLARVQGEKFPFILPPLKHNLVDQDPTQGPWASGMTEREFCAKYGLLKEDKTIDRVKAEQVFKDQLGRPFESLKYLERHELALFALFAVRACFDFDEGDGNPYSTMLINQFARSYTETGKLDMTGVNELIVRCTKHKEWKKINRILKRHAFVSTMLISMLQLGRQSGVLAPVSFLWLKPVDRTLWYALHQMEPPSPSTLLGQLVRKRVWAEAAGVRAHWIAEKLSKRALLMPVVTEAVNGLELAMSEFDLTDEDDD